jgi:hypothetical protein
MTGSDVGVAMLRSDDTSSSAPVARPAAVMVGFVLASSTHDLVAAATLAQERDPNGRLIESDLHRRPPAPDRTPPACLTP